MRRSYVSHIGSSGGIIYTERLRASHEKSGQTWPSLHVSGSTDAMNAEIYQLQAKKVFDSDQVYKKECVRRTDPEARFVSFDMVIGIKHFEMRPEFHKCKARGVVEGYHVRNSEGYRVVDRGEPLCITNWNY